MMSGKNVPRLLQPVIRQALEWSPVVAVTGPRTAGKSTLARRLIEDVGGTFLDLDDPSMRALAHSDPTAFVRACPSRWCSMSSSVHRTCLRRSRPS
jgi:predicted AAA+ superfamily ATPase